MSNKITELKKDIAELESLSKQSTRQKVKDLLSIETRKMVSEVVKLQEELNKETASIPASTSTTKLNKRYEVKLNNNYAWDQTSKFVKFYVTLPKVHTIPSENVTCQFTNKSLELCVKDLENKDYALKITNLLKTVVPEQSTWKIKSDMVIVSVAKQAEDNWSHVTEWEKKTSDSQKVDTEKMDPQEGLMSLMKNMYDKGDDEMKRTIAKAWTESQNKGQMF